MPLVIDDACIFCGVCERACPNEAIKMGEWIYIIDPDLCTECVGYFKKPQCEVVCPVGCCLPDPDNVLTEEALLERAKANRGDDEEEPTLKPKSSGWWERLFPPVGDVAPTGDEKE
jgi:ferredoxin